VFAGLAPDLVVVCTDEGREAVAFDPAVDHDHRDARLEGALDDGRERFRLVGRDHQQIDALAEEVLDIGYLLRVVLLGVGEHDLHVRKVLRPRSDLGVHGDAPGLAEVTLREADEVFGGRP